jgi:hypothetical protein
MVRRLVVVALAAMLASPAFVIAPARAAVLFTCSSVTGSGVFAPGLVHDRRPQSLSSGPAAPAGPADVRLASTNDTGVKANGLTFAGLLSSDGSRLVFVSRATNLDPADTDSIYDIFVKDLDSGDVTVVSTSDTGVKGNEDSVRGFSFAANGDRVAFLSRASNLDPADTDSEEDVYVKDLTTGDLTLASTSDTGVKGNGSAPDATYYQFFSSVSLSADGTRVAFISNATNLDPADTDTAYDVYVKNLNTGNIDLASRSDTGVKGNSDSGFEVALSADGARVAFASSATNLDPSDTDSTRDVYVKNRTTGDITLASTSDTGIKGNAVSTHPSLSPDGTKLAFESRANNLDPADTANPVSDIYMKDLTTGDITLASTSDTGVKGNNNSDSAVVSADGAKVVFTSHSTNLEPADTTTTDWDVHVKDLATGDLSLVSASDAGVGGDAGSFIGSPSSDFTTVGFSSNARNLDPADGPQLDFDVYVKQMPSVPTSIAIGDCSNGNSGTASVVDIRSYGSRPLGCPTSLGGAAGNDYPDTTPILVGATLSMTIDWATGPNSYGVAAAKAGPTGTQWRVRLAITASPGHDTPATNQYLPAAGSGATKTRLQGKLDIDALDSLECTSGTADPFSWVDVVNNGVWVAKTS